MEDQSLPLDCRPRCRGSSRNTRQSNKGSWRDYKWKWCACEKRGTGRRHCDTENYKVDCVTRFQEGGNHGPLPQRDAGAYSLEVPQGQGVPEGNQGPLPQPRRPEPRTTPHHRGAEGLKADPNPEPHHTTEGRDSKQTQIPNHTAPQGGEKGYQPLGGEGGGAGRTGIIHLGYLPVTCLSPPFSSY